MTAESWHVLTEAPRRYGWHATLKAPFSLKQRIGEARLRESTRLLARHLVPLTFGGWTVKRLGSFLALVNTDAEDAIQSLAQACVTELHPLVAPLPDSELARRRAPGLTPRQDELLLEWGYPHVFEQFRFHFSLTGPIDHLGDEQVDAIADTARAWFHPLGSLSVDQVALFTEPAPGADFVWQCAFPLGGGEL
jgi:Protein of unknown function (DUF1045)